MPRITHFEKLSFSKGLTYIIHLSLSLLLSLKHIFRKLFIAQIGATTFMFIFYFLGL